jgi:nitrite reductase/ring-hydroxylating ferredoxin subunit
MPTAEISIKALPLDTPFAFETAGMKIVLVRTNEHVYAFEDVCPHAFWPLSAGTFRDGVLECPGHGWEFRVQTGQCHESPAYCLTPISAGIANGVVRLEWEAANTLEDRKNVLCPRPGKAAVNAGAEAISQLQD